jgi:WD40 repeat protein
MIIGDTGPAAGIGLVTAPDGYAEGWAVSTGLWNGLRSWGSLSGKRTHVAGVLVDRKLSLFVNGKQAGSFDLPGSFESSSSPFCIGGNANVPGGPSQLLNGIIEQVRISNSARYRGDFEPALSLETDASTLLDYQFDRDTEDFANDTSGHGNNGVILGADLVLLLDAPLAERSPLADGKIGAGEYGPPLQVDYATTRNPGRLIIFNAEGRKWSPTVPPQDLSFALYAAHTQRSLFLAFRVTDDFIDDEPEDNGVVFFNDCVELFIDGDRVPNDFGPGGDPAKGAGREGFQIIADARGRQFTKSADFTNGDWRVGTSRLADGYIIEFEIPLSLIDTSDGAPYTPATTGSFLWFNAAVTDNDSNVHTQEDYGPLWQVGPAGIGGQSPAALGEKGWRVGLSLTPPRAIELTAVSDGGPPRRILQYNGAGLEVGSLALTPAGRTLVAGENRFVRSWDLATGRERFRVRTDKHVRWADITPDGATVVTGEYRLLKPTEAAAVSVVVVRDGATGAARHEMNAGPQGLHGGALSPDGKIFVSTCWSEHGLRVWDTGTGQQKGTLEGHRSGPTAVVFRPDGKVLASTGYDSTVRLWDMATGQNLKTLEGHQKGCYAIALSADGKLLASGGFDHTARVWDAATGQLLAALEHDRSVLSLAFSPDGKTLATGSTGWDDVQWKYAPTRIRLWDLADNRPRITLPEQPVQVFALIFTPDGKTLITGDRNGAITLWDVASARGAAAR